MHNYLSSNKTRTAIWEQLHLNFYTQYSYNKWHSTSDLCPLCHEIPDDIYHIMLHCQFTNTIWADLQPKLRRFHSRSINDEEKALGLVNVRSSPGILLRNWVTFKVREQIMNFEKNAYHSGLPSIDSFKAQFNQSMADEVKQIIHRYINEGSTTKVDKLIAFRGVLCKNSTNGHYTINPIFTL